MTDNNHPITPPPELVKQWLTEGHHQDYCTAAEHAVFQAANWGADMELEACYAWVTNELNMPGSAICLREDRRPKPPSLKEQALAELELLRGDANAHGLGFDAPAIRRALESLPD